MIRTKFGGKARLLDCRIMARFNGGTLHFF